MDEVEDLRLRLMELEVSLNKLETVLGSFIKGRMSEHTHVGMLAAAAFYGALILALAVAYG